MWPAEAADQEGEGFRGHRGSASWCEHGVQQQPAAAAALLSALPGAACRWGSYSRDCRVGLAALTLAPTLTLTLMLTLTLICSHALVCIEFCAATDIVHDKSIALTASCLLLRLFSWLQSGSELTSPLAAFMHHCHYWY